MFMWMTAIEENFKLCFSYLKQHIYEWRYMKCTMLKQHIHEVYHLRISH